MFGSAGNDLGDFARLQQNGDDLTLQVDAEGAAGAQTWTDTATFVAPAPTFDAVKALFTDDNDANAAGQQDEDDDKSS